MSRSYKKVPGWTDYSRNRTRWSKRTASKAVRRSKNVPDGGAYKRAYCSYDIRDWGWVYHTDLELFRYCERWGDKPYRAKMK